MEYYYILSKTTNFRTEQEIFKRVSETWVSSMCNIYIYIVIHGITARRVKLKPNYTSLASFPNVLHVLERNK